MNPLAMSRSGWRVSILSTRDAVLRTGCPAFRQPQSNSPPQSRHAVTGKKQNRAVASCPTSAESRKRCFGRCTIAQARLGDPTACWSIPRVCASNRRSTTTSRGISAIPRAHSRRARSKSTGRYGRGLSTIPRGPSYPLGRASKPRSRRVDNGRMRWLSVDLPEAIRLRERFLAPTHRFRHIVASALDPVWMDAVDRSSDVFIVAQGLLMYLAPERVRRLFASIADRFPGSELVFDAIPRWFSNLTLFGLNQTASYRLPSMPWGIDRDEVEPTLRSWHPGVAAVTFLSYRSPRGLPRLVAGMTNHIPVARHGVPSLVHVTIAGVFPVR